METKEKHELLVCPYDKLHMVEAYRFQRHLMKCGLVHKDMKMGQCSFDATHIVPIQELKYHQSICSARYRVEKDLHLKQVEPRANDDNAIIGSECWDDEDQTSPVLRKLGTDGFKPVFPKSKLSQIPVADVEGWLAGQYTDRSTVREDLTLDERIPRTMPKAVAGNREQKAMGKALGMPKVFPNAIGRGQKLSVPSVPLSLFELGRGRGNNQSHNHNGETAIPKPGMMLQTDSYSMNGAYLSNGHWPSNGHATKSTSSGHGIGRGRGSPIRCSSPITPKNTVGRGRAKVDCISSSPGSSIMSDCSEAATNVVKKQNCTVPRGLSRIAAQLGQSHVMNVSTSSSQSMDDDYPRDEEEKSKLIRKYKKKISEILILQKQHVAGRTLDDDQMRKIDKLQQFQQDLNELEKT